MINKIATIQTTSPDNTWIQNFERSLIELGVDASTINSFHRCLAETGSNMEEAKRLFERIQEETKYDIHLLLSPERHKNYLRAIAKATHALGTDKNSLLIYDTSDLRDGATNDLGSELSVDNVLEFWKEEFPNQVFSRSQALEYLMKILPIRESV